MSAPPRLVSAQLARRLGRLAASAHGFHRFAHHPLCHAYAPEVLRVGRRGRVCAGCASAAMGAGLGLAMGALVPAASLNATRASMLMAAGLVGLTIMVRRHTRHKFLGRGAPLLLLAWGAVGLMRAGWHAVAAGSWPTGPTMAAAGFGMGGLLLAKMYRQRRPWRAPCIACPQRSRQVCDGWLRIVQRERALHRLSGQLLERARHAESR